MLRRINRPVSISLITLLCVALVGQYSGDFVLGGKRLFAVSAPYLSEATPIQAAVGSPTYLASVGGVAFDQVANPAPGQLVGKLSLSYDPALDDGDRLRLAFAVQPVRAPIYDWQLIPIAKYANSPYFACFTLFGKLNDPKLQAQVDSSFMQSKRAMNYHPNLANTLVGLRMFQLDEHILSEDSAELPMLKGVYILGAGESPPSPEIGREALAKLGEGIDRIVQTTQQFQSYLICDYRRPVAFSVVNGELLMTGTPYYYFWTRTHDDKLLFLRKLSDWVSMQKTLLREVNPAVWDAGVHVMRYAAFFRYCKRRYPAEWKTFLNQIGKVQPQPKVRTPTYMIEPNR